MAQLAVLAMRNINWRCGRGAWRRAPVSQARVAALAAALLLCGCDSATTEWLRVAERDRPITIDASGIVVSEDVLRFSAPPSRSWSMVITHLAQEGRNVAEGELLVQFDGSGMDDRVRDLAGELAEAREERKSLVERQAHEMADEKVALAAAESRARKAARKAEQPAELIGSVEYQKLAEEKRVAAELLALMRRRGPLSERARTARRLELEATVRQREIQHAAAAQELAAFTLLAPRAGLFVIGADYMGNKLDVGSSVHPGLLIAELASDEALAVRAEVPEHWAARLAVGQPAHLLVDAAGGVEVDGRVAAVASSVRRKSRDSPAMVRDARVVLPPGTEGLRLGMSVQVTIEVAVAEDALAVPGNAIAYRDGAPGVFRRGSGWVPVALGERSEDTFVVTAGLNDGDEVRL